MDLKTLEELIRMFEASSLGELEIEEDGRRMCLKKGGVMPVYQASYAPMNALSAASAGPVPAPLIPEPEHIATIDSPMVGTFYLAAAPGEPAFASPGDRIAESQTVCIVEAMKLMNEVGAKIACIIEKVFVENGQPVEFGQPLFAIRPL